MSKDDDTCSQHSNPCPKCGRTEIHKLCSELTSEPVKFTPSLAASLVCSRCADPENWTLAKKGQFPEWWHQRGSELRQCLAWSIHHWVENNPCGERDKPCPKHDPAPVAPESYKPAPKEVSPVVAYTNRFGVMAPMCTFGCTEAQYDLRCFIHRPAATPVTVEAPDARKAVEDWFKLPDHDLEFRHRSDLCEGTNIIDVTCTFCRVITAMAAYRRESAATPKPIGDVEAVARKIYEASPVINGEVRPSFDEIIRILIPFFARISDKTLNAIVQDVAELPDRTSPDDWPEAMLVTAEELKAIISGNIEESAQPPCSECATLRKERDDYEKAIAKALRFTPSEEEPEECAPWMVEAEPEPMGPFSLIEAITAMMEMFDREFSKADKRGEAAEAQLSTLRDALRSIEELALACIDTHETTCANMDGIQGIAEAALAPTPEVAKE